MSKVVELYAPIGYEPKADCNGCGTGWNAKIVPDTIYGLSIKPSCCIHDYMYEVGIADNRGKEEADRVFLNNLTRQIMAHKKWYYPTKLALLRAKTYYNTVKYFGGDAYWENKNEN